MTRTLSSPKGRIGGPYDLFAAGRSVLALVKIVAQRVNNRRAVVQLLDWDDRALRDIGLTRSDVHLSLALPYREDPSTRLTFWASERRSARLARSADVAEPDRPQLRVVSGRSRAMRDSISR
jgi:uncharacterized protein YjiS (DUF1127 family)